MKESKRERKKEKKKANISSSCKRKYGEVLGIKKFFTPSYILVMLIYSILIFYGYNQIFIDYLIYDIIDITETIQIVVFLVITFIVFIIFVFITYKNTKFKFLYHFIYIILSTILANLGIVLFLTNNFDITEIEIFNIFLYLVLVGFITSLISYSMLITLILIRCKNVEKND